MQKATGPKHKAALLDNYRSAICAAVFLLCSFVSQAQKLQPINNYGGEVKRLQVDTSFAFPTGCGTPSANPWLNNVVPSLNSRLYFDTCGHVLWVYDNSTSGWSGLTSGAVTDTSHLSARINLKLNFADTTGMLFPYAQKNAVVMSVGVPFFSANVAASRPAFGNVGYLFLATDTKLLYRDNGGSWDLIGGGSGGGTTLTGPGYVKMSGGAPTYITSIPHADIAATAVTPGSYTNSNITVQADGTITAIANGSTGGGSVNTSVGGQANIAITGTNNVKTLGSGLAIKIDTATTNVVRPVLDTTIATGTHAWEPFLSDSNRVNKGYATPTSVAAAINAIPVDSFRFKNVGAGISMIYVSGDSGYVSTLVGQFPIISEKLGDSSTRVRADTSHLRTSLTPFADLQDTAAIHWAAIQALIASEATKVINAGSSTSFKAGVYSARPSASTCLCYYVATDSTKLYYDNGSWLTIGGGSGGGGGSTTYAALTDVLLTSLANGQIMQWNSGSSKWVNITPTSALVGLSNVPNVDATNASNIASGTLPVGRLPAFSGGNVTSSAGSAVLTIGALQVATGMIANNAVTLAKQATGTVNSLQGWDGSGNAAGVTIDAPLLLASGHLKGDTSAGRQHFATQAALADSSATLVHNNKYTAKGDLILGTGAGTYGVLPLGPSSSVPVVDLSQPTGWNWFIQPITYNIFSPAYHAYGDGQLATDAYMTSGAPDLYSTQMTFIPADTIGVGAGTQKYILIKGVGASGNDTLTKIASYISAHHITVLVNSSTTGGGHIIKFGHDDAPAFNAALSAAFANGGGEVIVPSLSKHFYCIAGPLIHSDNTGHDPNSQIWFPSENVPQSSNPDSTPIVVKMTGAIAPATQLTALANDSSQIWNTGCMLVSMLTTGYGNGAMIGTAYGTNVGFGNFSNATSMIENIQVQIPDGLRGAYRSGIDFGYAAEMYIKNCLVSTDVPSTQTHAPAFPVFGFRATNVGGGVKVYFDGFNLAMGFRYGYVISEHGSAQILSAQCNTYGILFVASNHASHISTLKAQWNANSIFADTLATTAGGAQIQIDQMDVEGYNSPGRWWSFNRAFNDSLHKMQGTIGYFFSIASGSSTPLPTWNPTTTNVVFKKIGDALNNPFLISGGANQLQSGTEGAINPASNPVFEEYAGNSASTDQYWPQHVLSNFQTAKGFLIGQLMFNNRYLNNPVADVYTKTGDSTNSGIMYLRAYHQGTGIISQTIDGLTNTFGVPIVTIASTASNPAMIITKSAIDPTTPKSGWLWYDSLTDALNFYHGTTLTNILAGSGGGGTPGGSDQAIQYDSLGHFGGNTAKLSINYSTGALISTSTAADQLYVGGSSASRSGIMIQSTNSASQATLYMQNNRGSLATYAGNLVGGTTNAIGNLFGVARPDVYFNFADGASSLGMAIGCLQSQPLILGTNNADRMHIFGNGDIQVGGTTDKPSALLAITSTTKGFLPPSMTTTQVNAISSPTEGLYVHDNTLHVQKYFDGTAWQTVSIGGGSGVTTVGTFSGSSQTNGASIASTTITFGPADATNPGMVTTGTQTIAGVKTFNSSPVIPTATALDNSTKAASTAYVDGAVTATKSNKFTETADNTITNTTTITTLAGTGTGSVTLAANTVSSGQTITVRGFAYVSTAGSAPSFQINSTNGSFTASIGPTLTASMSSVPVEYEVTWTCRTSGSSGTVELDGWVSINGTKTYFTPASLPFDTTVGELVDLRCGFGTASASNTIVTKTFRVTLN